MKKTITIGLTLMLAALGVACGGSSPSAKPCALVRYWADTSGSVADPDSGITTESEVVDLAREGWPNDTGTAAQFVQLFDELQSDMSDAAYGAEAKAFTSANC